MTYQFCTIATADYFPQVMVLQASLLRHAKNACLHVLFIDTFIPSKAIANLSIYSPMQLQEIENAAIILHKYNHEQDKLRWALKPVFLSYVLQQQEKVIYLDTDVFFFSSYSFLFEQLKNHSLLVTPHWSPYYPLPHTADFELSYKIGLFNAGFLGATKSAIPTLRWWTELCAFKMTKDVANGYFDDQRYLDMLVVVDEKIGVVRHPGCNVAGWNIHQNKRSAKEGATVINESYPIVFIHFNQSTIDQIAAGHDKLLQPYLLLYKEAFKELGYVMEEVKPSFARPPSPPLVKVKRALRLRTRLKQFVFSIYEKL